MMRCTPTLIALVLAASATPSLADGPSPAEQTESSARRAYGEAKYVDAAKLFLEAYKQGGKASMLFNAGLAYQKANDWRVASKQYRAYLKQAPGGPKSREARTRLGELEGFLAAEDTNKAKMAKELAETHAAAAQSMRDSGNHGQAARFFKKAFDTNQDLNYLFEVAQSLRQAGMSSNAIEAYERYLAKAGQSKHALEARTQLHALKQAAAATATPNSEPIVSVPEPAVPQPAATKPPVQPTAAPPQPAPRPIRISSSLSYQPKRRNKAKEKWAVRIGLVSAGSFITAGVFGIQAYSREVDLADEGLGGCNDDRSVCSPVGLKLYENAQTAATRANIALGVGAVAGLAAWYLWSSADESSTTGTASIQLSPTLAGEEVGFAISGAWN